MPTFLFHQQFTHIQGMMQSFRWFTTNQLKYQTQKNQIPSHSHIWTESIWVVKLVLSFSENQFGNEFRKPSNPSQCPKLYHWLKVEKSTSGVQLDFMHQENGPNNCDWPTFYLAMSFFSDWKFTAASISVNSPHFRQVNISLQQCHEKQAHCESFYLRQFFIIGLHGTDSSCYWCDIRQ